MKPLFENFLQYWSSTVTRKYTRSFFLICASSWLAQTVLVDFFVVPTLFRHIDSFFQAGTVGMLLFQKMNHFDLCWAFGLLLFSIQRTRLFQRIGVFFLIFIALTYYVYLTPHLVNLTEMWKTAEAAGVIASGGYKDIQQEHQFFHNMYRSLEVVKITLLLFLLGSEIRASE